ncbi:M1 family aminopeptidase [Thermococcus barophilus]|nr:M1 family aminopeptidase [Thermococcus barophilus]
MKTMKRKYLLGVLSVFIIFLLFFMRDDNNIQVTHVNILNLSISLVSDEELNNLANQSVIKGYSQVKIRIFENYTFNANKTIKVGNTGVVYVPVLYSPRIHFNDIFIENAELLNASILVSERGSILLLKLKIPKGTRAGIRFEYQGSIREQICARVGIIRTLFVKYESPDEIEMCPEMFLPEISNGFLETKIILELPQSWRTWTGIIVSNSGVLEPKAQLNGRLIFTSRGLFIPFLILGDFKMMRYNVNDVKVEIYFPKYLSLNVSSRYEDVVGDIIRTFSSWYMPYPYQNLTIIFSSNMMRMTGINKNSPILITANATPSLLAHEISHSWFGGYAEFGNIDESLATYSEMSYMIRFYNEHPEELENYARYNLTTIQKVLDFVEERVLKYNHDYPKPLSQVYRTWIPNSTIRNAIMYDKGAFVFRSLQFVLGNETFFKGLRELLRECHNKECNLTDVQNVFERVSGQNLDWFFKEWFYTAKVPDYDVRNLSLEEKGGKYLLTFEIIDKNNFTMPLEVEVKTPTKSFIKKVWINGTARVEFELDKKPTEIILDPNEWMVNENKKYNVDEIEITIE